MHQEKKPFTPNVVIKNLEEQMYNSICYLFTDNRVNAYIESSKEL